MKKATREHLFQTVSHRPWALPSKPWRYYQEWNNVLFLHWKVPADLLHPFIPGNLELDTFNGEAWISLVAFTMEKIRPKNLPAFTPVSTFHEINVRTYVTRDNKPGVYFLSIEAQKLVSAKLSKLLSGLPYEKASMKRVFSEETHRYQSDLAKKEFRFRAAYSISNREPQKTPEDLWLTERYALYLDKGEQLYRYDIHHLPWELKSVHLSDLQTRYQLGELSIRRPPDSIHYSPGVQVIAWSKENITR